MMSGEDTDCPSAALECKYPGSTHRANVSDRSVVIVCESPVDIP